MTWFQEAQIRLHELTYILGRKITCTSVLRMISANMLLYYRHQV